jgi:hypothetical protein
VQQVTKTDGVEAKGMAQLAAGVVGDAAKVEESAKVILS